MSDMVIRDGVQSDFPQVLELNETFVHYLSPLDAGSLAALVGDAAYFRVAEFDNRVEAFLIGFLPGSPYDSLNYQWFDKRFSDFVYVDRIVVSQHAQGRSVGRRLYEDLTRFARSNGLARLTCEYNLKPMNEGSAKFHERYGFAEIGQQALTGGKIVSLQMYSIP